ncbi:DUF445 domain-containing protein, partial [Clostridium botulinum]|uniref:DUF445 domain-containing protein n=1 Tax=Clostridium botulinum TaxID=1491 RepID=UPI001E3FB0B7
MKFLIASIIGGIIGYLTNWIAIKMLFRPYEEKRIFGMKVPFTPGLIPKEKTRIAKSVGNAIGEHLLSSEIIVKSLCSENMNNRLKIWIAIKMLFRPYEEKRIFGMKVPFTPGLIPKEKTRIAKSVGNA